MIIVITIYFVFAATRSPLGKNTPKHVYLWFYFVFRLCYGTVCRSNFAALPSRGCSITYHKRSTVIIGWFRLCSDHAAILWYHYAVTNVHVSISTDRFSHHLLKLTVNVNYGWLVQYE
jgi:hypothetical protein